MAKEKDVLLSRSRNFNLVTYANEDFIKTVLASHACKANFIFHDSDENKQPHWHIVLRCKEATTGNAVLKWFSAAVDDDGVIQNTLIELCNNVKSSLRYLIHLDDKDKYQYSVDDVRSFGAGAINDFRESISCDNAELDTATQAVFALLDGCSVRSCVLSYGRDFIYHYDSIRRVVDMIKYEENPEKEFVSNDENER